MNTTKRKGKVMSNLCRVFGAGLIVSIFALPAAAQLTGGGVPDPAYMGNAMRLWLKADAGVTGVSEVTNWADQSNNNNDADLSLHSGSEGGPALVAGGFGGMPTLRFVKAETDWLGVPDSSSLSFTDDDPNDPTDQPYAIFFVADLATAFNTKLIGKGFNSDREYEFGFSGGRNISMGLYHDGNSGRIRRLSTTKTLGDPPPLILVGKYDGSETSDGITLATNGVPEAGYTLSNSDPNTNPYLGMNDKTLGMAINKFIPDHGGLFFDGDVSEILIYQKDLTAQEENAVGFYLQDKYGISGSYVLPSAPCDFDGGGCGLSDINLMMAQGDLTGAGVGVGAGNQFDLDGDDDIDGDDITEWLSLTGTENGFSSPMLRGDTDHVGASSPASRTVDITDFQNFLGGFTGAGSTWEVGNFNGDDVVDITDFSNHFLPNFSATGGGTYGAGQSIPEPSTVLLLGLGGLLLCYLGWGRVHLSVRFKD